MWEYMLELFVNRERQLAMHKLGSNTLDAQTEFSIRLYSYVH